MLPAPLGGVRKQVPQKNTAGGSSGRRPREGGETVSKKNPRYANGSLRRKYRERFRAMDAPCGICGGRLGPIRYDQPSDWQHPLSFVIDEIRPVARWRAFGYASPEDAARDWNNLQAAHRCCNAAKGAKVGFRFGEMRAVQKPVVQDGEW